MEYGYFNCFYPLFLAFNQLAFMRIDFDSDENAGLFLFSLFGPPIFFFFWFLPAIFRDLFWDGSSEDLKYYHLAADDEIVTAAGVASYCAFIVFMAKCTLCSAVYIVNIRHFDNLVHRFAFGFRRFYPISVLAYLLLSRSTDHAFLQILNFLMLSWLITVILGAKNYLDDGYEEYNLDDGYEDCFHHYLFQIDGVNDLVIHVNLIWKEVCFHSTDAGCWNVELVPKNLRDLPPWILEKIGDDLINQASDGDTNKCSMFHCRYFPKDP